MFSEQQFGRREPSLLPVVFREDRRVPLTGGFRQRFGVDPEAVFRQPEPQLLRRGHGAENQLYSGALYIIRSGDDPRDALPAHPADQNIRHAIPLRLELRQAVGQHEPHLFKHSGRRCVFPRPLQRSPVDVGHHGEPRASRFQEI